MAKYKKYLGIIVIVGLMLVIFIFYAFNLDSNKSNEFDETTEAISEANSTEESTSSVETQTETIPNASEEVINVMDYGAKGDGVTDDTNAFQNALNVASERALKLVIPESLEPYLILSSLELKSNTHIVGYDAGIYMPSHRKIQNIFTASSKIDISNITIEGITLVSENDQEGTGEYEGSLTSYVQGIYLFGVKNLTLKNVHMENMYIGIKLDAAKNGDKSEQISIDNLNIYNSRTPLFITSTTNLKMTNSVLDASGGATKFLHSAYIRGDTKDLEFNNVQFVNSPGGGIHIFNSNEEMAAPENMKFIDCKIENTKVGIYIYSGASDIYVSNLNMKNVELPFKINSAVRVNMEKIEISNSSAVSQPVGLFNIENISESQFSNVTYDGKGMTGFLFDIGSKVNDLTFSELSVSGLNDVGLLYGSSESIENLVIENSSFEWSSVKAPLIKFESAGSNAILRDNQFINNGSKMAFNTTDTNITLENNKFTGF